MTDDFKDWYAVLGLVNDTENPLSAKAIGSAFRKRALSCHPDKFPDDEEKAKQFELVQNAGEILKDETARAAFDLQWKAKHASAVRHQALDKRTQVMREDLQKREKQHKRNQELDARRRAGEAAREADHASTVRELKTQMLHRRHERDSASNINKKATTRKRAEPLHSTSSSAAATSVFSDTMPPAAQRRKMPNEAGTNSPELVKLRWSSRERTLTKIDLVQLLSRFGKVDQVEVFGKRRNRALVSFRGLTKSSSSSAAAAVIALKTAVLERTDPALAGIDVVLAQGEPDNISNKPERQIPSSTFTSSSSSPAAVPSSIARDTGGGGGVGVSDTVEFGHATEDALAEQQRLEEELLAGLM